MVQFEFGFLFLRLVQIFNIQFQVPRNFKFWNDWHFAKNVHFLVILFIRVSWDFKSVQIPTRANLATIATILTHNQVVHIHKSWSNLFSYLTPCSNFLFFIFDIPIPFFHYLPSPQNSTYQTTGCLKIPKVLYSRQVPFNFGLTLVPFQKSWFFVFVHSVHSRVLELKKG